MRVAEMTFWQQHHARGSDTGNIGEEENSFSEPTLLLTCAGEFSFRPDSKFADQ
jgi:hypothetical protein